MARRGFIQFCIGAFLAAALIGCSGSESSERVRNSELPYYSHGKYVSISTEDEEQFVIDNMGYSSLLFAHNIEFLTASRSGREVQNELDELFAEDDWRMASDWYGFLPFEYSNWTKGDLELFVFTIDDLDNEILSSLDSAYGLDRLETGDTLIVFYVLDHSRPLPDLTQTSQAMDVEATLDALQATNDAQATLAPIQTATAEAAMRATTYAQATLAPIQTATAEASARAAMDSHSDEFNRTSLANHWTIYRETASDWDLTKEPGMLHIVGQDPKRGGILDIFGTRVTAGDIEVITRFECHNMKTAGDSVWIGFTPNDYADANIRDTVELGLAYGGAGYYIYMWQTVNDSGTIVEQRTENISFDGTIYLKMVRKDSNVTGYYRVDGGKWIYVGELNEPVTPTDQVILGAGTGEVGQTKEFDAYFDYIRFSLPSD